jgi:hypothetical protein
LSIESDGDRRAYLGVVSEVALEGFANPSESLVAMSFDHVPQSSHTWIPFSKHRFAPRCITSRSRWST